MSSTASTISPSLQDSSRDASIQSPGFAPSNALPLPMSMLPPLSTLTVQLPSGEPAANAQGHSKADTQASEGDGCVEVLGQVPSTPRGSCVVPPAAQRRKYSRCGSSSQVGREIWVSIARAHLLVRFMSDMECCRLGQTPAEAHRYL